MCKKNVCILALAFYIAFVYWITVFSRDAYPQAGSDWRIFWTYGAIADGRDELIVEVIFNLLMFLPIGLIVGLVVRYGGWLVAFFSGAALSLGIEMLQLHLKRGLCETDDIIHNTLGCLIGFALIRILGVIYRKQGII